MAQSRSAGLHAACSAALLSLGCLFILPAHGAQADAWTDSFTLARELAKQGDYSKAVAASKKALALAERGPGDEDARELKVWDNLIQLGTLQSKAGDKPGAESSYSRALALQEKRFPKDWASVALSTLYLAKLYEEQGQDAKAEPRFKSALGYLQIVYGNGAEALITPLNGLGKIQIKRGDYAGAEQTLQRALQIADQRQLGFGTEVRDLYASQALLDRKTGKEEHAQQMEAKAAAVTVVAPMPATK
jgi:tetratricopeptide (TPR) repeat protein